MSKRAQSSLEKDSKKVKVQTFALPEIYARIQPLPTRSTTNTLFFPDYPQFNPNLTPKEVLQLGSFGGTYFRTIYSSITEKSYTDAHLEFPLDWFEGLNIAKAITASVYNKAHNTYKIDCGGDLDMWESSGWIRATDPFGWFQWYCRFYLGRRSSDDERQIARGLGVFGEKGRWRRNLINKCLAKGKPEKVIEDKSISPKIRQLLQHWGYRLTLEDLQNGQ